MVNIPVKNMADGQQMPQLGFGVWRVEDAAATTAVAEALRVGYRSIDTAQMYQNEAGVGRGISDSGVSRSEIFLTTKLDNKAHGLDEAQGALAASLERLGTDYVDLFLIHWPLPVQDRYVDAWRGFIELQRSGLAKAIGVSNFTIEYLRRLVDETGVTPAVNQIELHPYFQQRELRAEHAERGILTEAWSPLGQGGDLLADPVLVEIARAHDATPAQVVIAWHLAVGNVVIPKSVTPSRIAENFQSAGLTLTPDEVAAIDGLDRGGRIGPDPVTIGVPW